MERFVDLSEREILALAIFSEEEDSKIYRGFAEGLREQYPASAKVFDEMADEEVRHRTMLFDLYRSKFGDFLPLIRRQDVKGFIKRKPLWLTRPLGLDEVRKYAETMELAAPREWRVYYAPSGSAHGLKRRAVFSLFVHAFHRLYSPVGFVPNSPFAISRGMPG